MEIPLGSLDESLGALSLLSCLFFCLLNLRRAVGALIVSFLNLDVAATVRNQRLALILLDGWLLGADSRLSLGLLDLLDPCVLLVAYLRRNHTIFLFVVSPLLLQDVSLASFAFVLAIVIAVSGDDS